MTNFIKVEMFRFTSRPFQRTY